MWQPAKTRQRKGLGYGLLEIALGIAIAALLVAGAMMYFNNANQERRINESVQLVSAVLAISQSLYHGQPNYAGVSARQVVASRQLPDKFIKGTGIRHPFGGSVGIGTEYNNRAVKIVLYGMPRTACVAMMTKPMSAKELIVNSTGTSNGRDDDEGERGTAVGVMTVAQASRLCSQPFNIISWIY